MYDAVLTVEYSFLIPRKEVQLPCKSLKNFAVRWLLILDNALQSARDNNDQAKVTSYTSAFSKSRLPSELIKWVTCQTAMGGKMSTPNLSTPITLIKWLLIVEDLGVRVFDCDISKIHAKALICKSRVESELPIFMANGKLNDYHFFHTNNETRRHDKVDDDLEMVDFVDTEFSASPGLMKPIAVGGTKKRKEGRNIEDKPPVKIFKCHFHENTTSDKFSPLGNDNGLSGGSEVENSASDEDMEDMKQ